MSYYTGWEPPKADSRDKPTLPPRHEPTDDPRYLLAAVMPERDFVESSESLALKLKVGVSAFDGANIEL